MTALQKDRVRYVNGPMPKFQKYYRKAQMARNGAMRLFYRTLFSHYKKKNLIDLYYQTQIGAGLYIGHPYAITIHKDAILGRNCNLHKGVTIGQANRGPRKGTPVLGNQVWVGVNATIVGAVTIGDDVLIGPNSYVNRDVPSHSVVFGNPCVIKPREYATEGYINNQYEG